MRTFLFKILFRLTWWIAPDKPRVNKIFEMYLEFLKEEEDREECRKRQEYLDSHVRPRTETYEYLTCKNQRDFYTKYMPPRIADSNQPLSHYSDYEEAKAYHEGRYKEMSRYPKKN